MAKKNVQLKKRVRPRTPNTDQARITATLARLNRIKPKSAKAARALALLQSWLADESGYDELVWPRLKKALEEERERAGARRLFDG